jgi:hypothetical protein
MTENKGRQPASNRPRKNRQATKPAKLVQAGVHDCTIPHPRSSVGIRIRCGTLTIRKDENGCHMSWAIGAMEPTTEYWFPTRPVASCKPNNALNPSIVLSRIYDLELDLSISILAAKNCKYLKKIDPDQDREDNFVRFATYPLVLWFRQHRRLIFIEN